MKVAILGATSQLARDLVHAMLKGSTHELFLYSRRPEVVSEWLSKLDFCNCCFVGDFQALECAPELDAVVNFVGVGNPALAMRLGASIFDTTLHYDQLALDYLRKNPQCRYLFLSSGAAYGGEFLRPVDQNTHASICINSLSPQEWYGAAKLYAECRHRALEDFSIVDIRVFNYFSRSQDVEARFLVSDILRAIRDGITLKISPTKAVRDFLHPTDFHQLVEALLVRPAINTAVDCYTLAPVDKMDLLAAMQHKFGLCYEISNNNLDFNATGTKQHYYSLNRRAAELGYKPQFTALETVLLEAQCILNL